MASATVHGVRSSLEGKLTHGRSPLSISSNLSGSGALSPGSSGPQTPSSGKQRFAVFDLVEEPAPKTFHEAAEKGNTNMAVRMIERTIDFDINQRDRLNRTALHWAAENGHHDTAKMLVDFGIDVHAKECGGRTALHMAARTGDRDMMAALLEKLPSEQERLDLVNHADVNGLTPAFLALQKGEEGQAAFEYLMSNGARFNQEAIQFDINGKPIPPSSSGVVQH